MIAYRAMVDVPRELVQYLGRLLAAERRARGTRRGTRALTCFYQALLEWNRANPARPLWLIQPMTRPRTTAPRRNQTNRLAR